MLYTEIFFGAPRLLNFPKVFTNTFIPPTTFIRNTSFPRLLVLLQAFLLMIVDWKNTEWVKKKNKKESRSSQCAINGATRS